MAGFRVRAPEVQEKGELSNAVFDGPSTKLDASISLGAIDDNFRGIPVVSALREDATSGFTLDFGESRHSKVAKWQRVADAREVDQVVERPTLMALKGAPSDDGRFGVTVGSKSGERAFLRTSWFLVHAKGLVGGIGTQCLEGVKR